MNTLSASTRADPPNNNNQKLNSHTPSSSFHLKLVPRLYISFKTNDESINVSIGLNCFQPQGYIIGAFPKFSFCFVYIIFEGIAPSSAAYVAGITIEFDPYLLAKLTQPKEENENKTKNLGLVYRKMRFKKYIGTQITTRKRILQSVSDYHRRLDTII